uniref:Derlin n=1 Tax=Phallusia mammillata TaxID=59560 RepID=A0A6F9DA89_9ASCI|nr:derlin-1-like [Phallusia mammillata]
MQKLFFEVENLFDCVIVVRNQQISKKTGVKSRKVKMSQNDLGDWYRSIPRITRYWFTAAVAVPLAGKFGLLNPMWLILDYASLVSGFQIWRPVSAAVYYPITPMTGFHYLITLYFLYSYSTRLETGIFTGRPADYVFMLLFNWATTVILALALGIPIIFELLVLAALYIWCQINRDQIVSFWFGTRFKAAYLPWVLFAFNLIIRGGGMHELLGIFVGHLYFFLKFKYPIDFGGMSLLETPRFLFHYFPNTRTGVSGFGTAPQPRRRDNNDGGGGAHAWGQGQALGGN